MTRSRALGLVALAQIAIGAAAIFARYALDGGGGPLAIGAARLTIAAIPLLILAVMRGALRVDRGTAVRLALAGLALAAHFGCWIASLAHASVAISTLLVCTTPIFTEIYAVVRRRAIDGWTAASIIGALAGVTIVVGAPDRANTPLGIVLALAGALAIGVYLLLVRGVDARYGTLTVTARTYSLAAVALALGAIVAREHLPAPNDVSAWGGIFAMALISQMFGHTALNAAVRVLTATFVSTVTLLEPVVAAVLAAWLFGERLGAATGIGAAIILGAIALAVRSA